MDGAGTTIFDRIEQKLYAAGVEVDVQDLKDAVNHYDARIAASPADLEVKITGLELKLVLVARLLNAAVDALPQGHVPVEAAEAVPATGGDAVAAQKPQAQVTVARKRLLQNPKTGVIEEVEDTGDNSVIVADGRMRGRGPGAAGPGGKSEKKCVFISAVDDEAAAAAKK